jgi:uncharacterized protein (DUF433 family)
MIAFYNEQRLSYQEKNKKTDNDFDSNSNMISWSRSLRKDAENNVAHSFNESEITQGMYRPFVKMPFYYHKPFIESPGLGKQIFPKDQKNIVITLPGLGNRKDFVAFVTNVIPDYNNYDGGCKYFPLYYFEERKVENPGLFDAAGESKFIRRDGVSDFILNRARSIYGKGISKEDIFYYVYGFMHSSHYRIQFANDLKKMLPRLPLVEAVSDFYKFSKAGRQLAELHTNYETVPPYKDIVVTGEDSGMLQVEKMRFLKNQKDTIIYNSHITVQNIPAEAYEYVLNGKSAIEWIMDRYQITTHKESGIQNDPNDWATETGNSRYILNLLLSIINVSVQTVQIVKGLPIAIFDTDEKIMNTENIIYNLDELPTIHKYPTTTDMREFSLNEGIYFINDVEQITKGQLKRDKLTRWFKELSKENYEGLSTGQQQDVNKMRISFYGLIELVVIGTLRDNNFPLKKILTARKNLKDLTNKIYPFATNNVRDDLKVAGNSIKFQIGEDVVTLDGTSQLNLDIIKSFFANISFDTEGLAQQLFPLKDSKLIVVDPKQGGGKAVINNGSAVWAETIASIYDGPGSIDMLSAQYDITKEQILAAVEYLN